jgi:RNA polymerase sigma-70 factor, ECF subfamily
MSTTSSGIDSAIAATPPKLEGETPDVSLVSTKDLKRSEVEALIARDYAGLRTLIHRRTGDIQVAADLLNDAICTAWEKWLDGRIAHPEQIAGYIFQTAINLMRNHRRIIANTPARRASSEALDSLPAGDGSKNDGIEVKVAQKVVGIIQSMSSYRDRTILVRFYLDEEDKESICRDLKITPAQFTKILHRARVRLRDLLESQGLKSTDMFSWLLV